MNLVQTQWRKILESDPEKSHIVMKTDVLAWGGSLSKLSTTQKPNTMQDNTIINSYGVSTGKSTSGDAALTAVPQKDSDKLLEDLRFPIPGGLW